MKAARKEHRSAPSYYRLSPSSSIVPNSQSPFRLYRLLPHQRHADDGKSAFHKDGHTHLLYQNHRSRCLSWHRKPHAATHRPILCRYLSCHPSSRHHTVRKFLRLYWGGGSHSSACGPTGISPATRPKYPESVRTLPSVLFLYA